MVPDGADESKAAGETGSRPTREDDERTRDLLASFSQILIQTLLKTGLYDPRHPTSKQALQGLYQSFRTAISGRLEMTYIAVRGVEHADVFIDGYFDEAISLSKVLRSGTAGLYVPKFLAYLDRHKLHSLSLNQRLDLDEMRSFIGTLLQSLGSGATPEQVRQTLAQRRVENISLLFAEDAVGAGRRVSWRAELALTRLAKDLRRVPMYTHLDPAQMLDVQGQVLADVLRPIRSGDLMAELLVNLDLVEEEMRGYGVSDPLGTVVENAGVETCPATIRALQLLLDRVTTEGQPRSRERPDLAEAAADLIRIVAQKIADTGRAEDLSMIEELVASQIIAAEQLPLAVKETIEVRAQVNEVLDAPQRHLAVIQASLDAAELGRELRHYARLIPALIHEGGGTVVGGALAALWARRNDPATPETIMPLITAAMRGLLSEETFEAARARFDEAKKEERVELARVLRLFGVRGARAMLEMLRTIDDRWARKSLIDALSAMGPGTEEQLVEELNRPANLWFVLRNVLDVVSRVGTRVSNSAIQKMLKHSDGRVRAAAVAAHVQVHRSAADKQLVAMLADSAEEVKVAVVEGFGRLQLGHPALANLIQCLFDPEQAEQYSMPLRRAACLAITRIGNMPITEGLDAEALLCAALAPRGRKVLGIKVSGKQPFSTAVRALLCYTLAQIGGERSREVLEQIIEDGEEGVAEGARRALAALG